MAQSTRLAASTTALTTTAVTLASGAASIREVLIQSDPANTTNVLVGNSTTQSLVLTPGQSVSIPINNLGAIWLKMVSGTGTANWMARD